MIRTRITFDLVENTKKTRKILIGIAVNAGMIKNRRVMEV